MAFTPGRADIAIEKTRIGSGAVHVGDEITFRLTARNDGDAPATGVVVHDPLPDGLAPVAVDATCTIEGQEVTCRAAELDPGAQLAFELRARAEPSAAGRTLVNRGTVTQVEADPQSANDASEAQVTVEPTRVLPAPPPQVTPSCASQRRFTIRIRERRARRVRSAEVRVAGRRVAVTRRRSDHRLTAVVDLRGLPPGTYRVEITARLRNGRLARWVRSYRTCTATLPPSNRLGDPGALHLRRQPEHAGIRRPGP